MNTFREINREKKSLDVTVETKEIVSCYVLNFLQSIVSLPIQDSGLLGSYCLKRLIFAFTQLHNHRQCTYTHPSSPTLSTPVHTHTHTLILTNPCTYTHHHQHYQLLLFNINSYCNYRGKRCKQNQSNFCCKVGTRVQGMNTRNRQMGK